MEPDQIKFYNTEYLNLSTRGLNGLYHKYTHRLMENLVPKHTYKNTLELGIGNNQHKKYVLHSYSLYIGIDLQSKFFSDVEFVKGDVSFLPFKNNSVQRIIVTCLLHHIGSVIKVLTEIKRIIDKESDFNITIIVPCDPGVLYRFFRYVIGKIRKFKRKEEETVSATVIHYLEHTGSYPSIDTLIKYCFSEFFILKKNYPLNLETWNFNLFSVYNISKK
jgi:hypothetical protein